MFGVNPTDGDGDPDADDSLGLDQWCELVPEDGAETVVARKVFYSPN